MATVDTAQKSISELHQDSPRFLSIHSRDADEIQAFFLKCGEPMRVVFEGKNRFDFETMAVECNGVSLAIANSRLGMEIALESPPNCYSMLLPSAGAMEFVKGKNKFLETRSDTGLIIDSHDVRVARFGQLCGWQRMAISSGQLHNHMKMLLDLPVCERINFKPHFAPQSAIARTMYAVSQAIIGGTRGQAPLLAAPSAMASLRDAVMSMFVEGMPHSYSERLERRTALPAPKNIRQAIDFMHANIGKPLQIADIANAVEVSPRSLQIAFKTFYGQTPMDYLRRLRLNGAHKDLISCSLGTSVAEVAYRWGFAHHGMFSANYAKVFNELPSVTLRRGARR